jgi:5'-nucleotidase (lipoprotein e(P4) family)
VNSTEAPIQTVVNGKLFTTAYQQNAAEYRALCYQAFNFARLRVDEIVKQPTTKPKAIMTDVDETVLSNAAYQAHQSLQGLDYTPDSWYEWTSKADADTVPGALSFLKYAASQGIEVFYVTNRDERERVGTLENLKKFNFPNAENSHLLLRQGVSSKDTRKFEIMKTHEIVLLMGDNLNDMSSLFEKKNVEDRRNMTTSFSEEFGRKFIVIPNPVYGDWENSIYNFNHSFTPSQKDSALRASLKSY